MITFASSKFFPSLIVVAAALMRKMIQLETADSVPACPI